MKRFFLNIFRKGNVATIVATTFSVVALISSLTFGIYVYSERNQNGPLWSSSLLDYSQGNSVVRNINLPESLEDQGNVALSLQGVYNYIANQAIPAVVSIQVESAQSSSGSPFVPGQEDFLKRFFGFEEVPERFSQAFGSGFIISPDGYLISNHHVVKGAKKITIQFKDDSKTYTAKIVGSDPDTDISLLKIDQDGEFPFLKMGNSDNTQIGDIVVAIGNPFNLSHTFTTGVISAIGRSGIANNKYENFLQTDVAINPGNSGGPLINLSGEVVGINSVIISRGGGNIGIGFSIPINMAKSIVDQLREKGRVVRGWMGIQYSEISADVASALNIDKKGVIISRVIEDSPAENAGLQGGDILISFNQKEIVRSADLLNEIAKTPIGKRVTLEYLRDGKKSRTTIRLTVAQTDEIAENEDIPDEDKPASKKYIGITVRSMDKDLLSKYRVKAPFGVVIDTIDQRTSLFLSGVRVDDVIEEINRKKIASVSAFESTMKNIDEGEKVLLKIRRDNSVFYFVVRK